MMNREQLLSLTTALEIHVQTCPAILGDEVTTELVAMVTMNTLLLDVDGEPVELTIRPLAPAPDIQNAPTARHVATFPAAQEG